MSGDEPTQKVTKIPILNEQQNAQFAYDQARDKMLKEPTKENIEAFGKANAHLFEVEDRYRIAAKLLTERAMTLKYAFLNILGARKR